MAREADRTRALGNLATGLGKTFVAAVDVMRYREECAAQDPPMYPRILYVSHKHDINEQAAKTFAAIMPDAEIDFFKTQRAQLPDADITFAAIQGLYSELDRFDPQGFEYIVWDESHHLEAETYKTVRDYFDPLFEHAITATMERMDGKDIQDYFGEPLYQKSLPEGIAEGHLADVEYHIVFDKTIKAKLAEGFNPKSLTDIRELFKNKPPVEEIARSIEEEIERLGLVSPKTIVFCENIEESEAMAAELGGVAYHSGAKDRPQTLDDFRSGRLRRVTTRDMFNEGTDIPDAELIIFLRGTNSPTIFEQQLGRGLRRAPGKDKVYVLDYVANVERIAKVRELSEAIQRRARQLGQLGGTEEGGILGEGDDSRGLHIRTEHGEFDFDSMAVDLLEKWGSVQEQDVRRMPNEEIVAWALRISPNKPLTHTEMTELAGAGSFVNPTTIYRRFGSLTAFKRLCGFEVKEKLDPNQLKTDGDIIGLALEIKADSALGVDEIKALAAEGRFVGYDVIKRRFGSMAAFQRACGFKPLGERMIVAGEMTNDDLIARAREISPDMPLSTKSIDALSRDEDFVSTATLISRFGSLTAFQRACGFDVRELPPKLNARRMNNDDLLTLALELSPGSVLSAQQVKDLSKEGRFVSLPTIASRFGSLADFQELCAAAIQARQKG